MVGSIDDRIAGWLGRKTDAGDLTNRGITWSVSELRHATRASKRARGAGLGPEDLDRIPDILRRPKKVFWDIEDGALLYVGNAVDAPGRLVKLVVRTNYRARLKIGGGRRETATTNSIRTAEYINPSDLHAARYSPVPDDK